MQSLNSFITKSLLIKIPKNLLEKVLLSMKDTLLEQSLWKNEKGNFKPTELARFLKDNANTEVENLLCAINSIAKDSLIDEIDAKCLKLKINTSITDTCIEKATLLALKSIKECNVVISKRLIDEVNTFTHFKPIKKLKIKVQTQEEAENFIPILKEYFLKTGKGNYADIYLKEIENYVYYCISHGSAKMRENSVDDLNEDELKVYTFRPELVDVIRVEKYSGKISINTRKSASTKLKDFYINMLRYAIAEGCVYTKDFKYNPNSIWYFNGRFILGELNSLIASVNIKNFYVDDDGCKARFSEDLSRALPEMIKRRATFKYIVFEFVFKSEISKRYTYKITDKEVSDNSCEDYIHIIEEFLQLNGFILTQNDESHFKLEAETSQIANEQLCVV